ncbi:DUF2784 domain-containing protein [Algoriphagus marincola]|uniref:DUF2784 domain-containing protein n=1 Tax=Algoriphagus marincola TaxID=264027 RepID=UPI000426EBB4|nr:DUF2784 domain-containing protein [Algoriphagus marincola]
MMIFTIVLNLPLFLADWFFVIFHSVLILFNLFGWVWRKTRKAHLITISLTLLSWGFLGIWYGWGYCPLTDWHWQVLEKMGTEGLPNSYISYLLERLLNWQPKQEWVDMGTLAFTLLAFGMSIWVNFRKKISTAKISE